MRDSVRIRAQVNEFGVEVELPLGLRVEDWQHLIQTAENLLKRVVEIDRAETDTGHARPKSDGAREQ